MIKPSDDSLRAYPNPNANLWVQDFVNGQYLIDYEFDDGLNQNVKTMLPKVLVLGRNKTEDLQEVIENLPVSWPFLVKEDVHIIGQVRPPDDHLIGNYLT